MNTHAKILFLDVDGVLNRCGKSAQGLETDKVELLRRIVEATGCAIVVSSTWRKSDYQMARLTTLCRDIGAKCLGATPIFARIPVNGRLTSQPRGREIQAWMDANGKPDRFVILDDDADMVHLTHWLIQTHCFTGLTPEIAQRVINALGSLPTTPTIHEPQKSKRSNH